MYSTFLQYDYHSLHKNMQKCDIGVGEEISIYRRKHNHGWLNDRSINWHLFSSFLLQNTKCTLSSLTTCRCGPEKQEWPWKAWQLWKASCQPMFQSRYSTALCYRLCWIGHHFHQTLLSYSYTSWESLQNRFEIRYYNNRLILWFKTFLLKIKLPWE